MTETVYRAVKEMVFLNRFRPGLHLNVERLSRELRVSRTPVWSAIRRLEQEGIVRKVPYQGVFMVEITLGRVREQVMVLNALDNLAGRLASERITEKMLGKLAICLADQLHGIENGVFVKFGVAEMRFHGYVYEASGIFYLKELFDLITSQLLPSRLNFIPALRAMYSANEALLEALSRHDPDGVEKASNEHIQAIVGAIDEQTKSETEKKEMVRFAQEKAPSSDKKDKRRRGRGNL